MFDLIARLVADNVGGRLVLPDRCVLPSRCAICNKPESTAPRRLRLHCTAVGSGFARMTILIHVCPWHGIRRKLLLIVFGILAVTNGLVVATMHEGEKPTPLQFTAFGLLIASALIFINSILHNPYFRGLDVEAGGMAIKGFGKKFRDGLKPDEIKPAELPG